MITVPNLRVTQFISRNAVVVAVAGEVDLYTVGLLTNGMAAAGLVSSPRRTLVVDLNAVTFFGAAGMTSLVVAAHNCQEQNVVLRIVADRRVVLRPLEIAGLIETLPMVTACRPESARRRRTLRATRAILNAARRILVVHSDTDAHTGRPTHTATSLKTPTDSRLPHRHGDRD